MDGIPLSDLIDEVVDTLMDVENFFVPLTITRGRKFTGNCYWLNSTEYSGAYGQAMTTANCAWDPKTKKEVWFNGSLDGTPGIVKWSVSDLEKSQALRDYVNHAIDVANKRCGSDDTYRMRWLRKVLHIDTDLAQDLSYAVGNKNLDSKWVLYSPSQKIYVLDFRKYPDVDGLTGPDVSKAQVFDTEQEAWERARKSHLTHVAMDWKPVPFDGTVDEEFKYFRIKRHYDPDRQEFLISFNDTKFDPMDSLYHRDMRVFARDERMALAQVKDQHPEFKITKVTKISERINMKKINENTKVTLTLKQLKKLVKEGMDLDETSDVVEREKQPKYPELYRVTMKLSYGGGVPHSKGANMILVFRYGKPMFIERPRYGVTTSTKQLTFTSPEQAEQFAKIALRNSYAGMSDMKVWREAWKETGKINKLADEWLKMPYEEFETRWGTVLLRSNK